MKKISLIILFNLLLMLNGCAKKISNEETQASSETDTADSEYKDTNSYLYDFSNIANDDFYHDVVVINNEELYRKLRFNDYETGSRVIGAGLVHILQTQDDGRQAAIISTKSNYNQNTGLYELLASKANFNGNLALLVFNPSEKARILNDDVIAFKGILAPSDTYTYTNDSGEIEEIPIIYVHYYKAGDLTIPLINKFLEKPKETVKSNETKAASTIKDQDNSKMSLEEKGNTSFENRQEITKVPDSTEVSWSREPKISYTNSDLQGESRNVSVEINANKNGNIISAEIKESSGIQDLDMKVIRAIKSAKLKKFFKDGEASPLNIEQSFELTPNENERL